MLRGMPWCTPELCHVCGQHYQDWSGGVTWADGLSLVRAANQPDGGWRSRGPVLWAMHCIKLDRWALRHLSCGVSWNGVELCTPDDPDFPF